MDLRINRRIHVVHHVLGRRDVVRHAAVRLGPLLDESLERPVGKQLCSAQRPPGVWAGSSVGRVDPSRDVRAFERGAARRHASADHRVVHHVAADGAEEVLRDQRRRCRRLNCRLDWSQSPNRRRDVRRRRGRLFRRRIVTHGRFAVDDALGGVHVPLASRNPARIVRRRRGRHPESLPEVTQQRRG